MRATFFSSLLLAISPVLCKPWGSTSNIPGAVVNGTSVAQFLSSSHGLDSPKVSPINQSAWDWWYFDVVSEDSLHSAVAVFYTAPETGFVFDEAPVTDINLASINIGIPGSPEFFGSGAFADVAKVVSTGNGASGKWENTGFEFVGSEDMKQYKIEINSPAIGVKGSISFNSVAPGHYPCSAAKAGQTMEIMPHIGWANAVPGAVAHVNLHVNGTLVKFSGVGYHDKNWGDVPFVNLVGSWYWGHGQLGPYTIVWYSALTPSGAQTQSAYVSLNGKIHQSSCSESDITVRPTGKDAVYPPTAGGAAPEGFKVVIKLDCGKTMEVDVTIKQQVLGGGGLYYRWTGSLKGGIKGEKSLTGTALLEQFALLPPS